MPSRGSLDLDALATFVDIVAQKSFSRGARARGIPRATATRQIASLERALGVRLIERTTRAMRVTDAGAELLERARRILAEIAAAQEAASERQGRLSGSIRLSAPVEYGMAFLGPIVAAFAKAHPDVHLSIELSSRRVDLVEDGFDLAIRIGPVPDSGYVAQRIGSVVFWLCAAPEYLRDRPPIRRPEDLSSQKILHFDTGDRRRIWKLRGPGRDVEVALEGASLDANSYGLLRRAALEGLGIVRLPSFFATEDVSSARLVRLLSRWTFPELPVQVLRQAGTPPLRTRALLEHLHPRHG